MKNIKADIVSVVKEHGQEIDEGKYIMSQEDIAEKLGETEEVINKAVGHQGGVELQEHQNE